MPRTSTPKEADSIYLLKILIYFILGTIWLRTSKAMLLPLGLIAGLLITRHERFRVDRKIEYAVILVAALMGFLGLGIFITL